MSDYLEQGYSQLLNYKTDSSLTSGGEIFDFEKTSDIIGSASSVSVINMVTDTITANQINSGDLTSQITFSGVGVFQTAENGQRCVITSSGFTAYDTSAAVLNINNSATNILEIIKTPATQSADCIRIVDTSTDTQASLTINCGGGAATKDGFLLQNSATLRRNLLHLELLGTGTLTNGLNITQSTAASVTNFLRIYQTAGTCSGNMLYLYTSGTSNNTHLAFFDNQGTSNVSALVARNGSSANDDTAWFIGSDATKNPLHLQQTVATSTNFYRMMKFSGGSTTLTLWIANNTTPNGALSGSAGDICLSSDGNIYRCTGTTNWTAM